MSIVNKLEDVLSLFQRNFLTPFSITLGLVLIVTFLSGLNIFTPQVILVSGLAWLSLGIVSWAYSKEERSRLRNVVLRAFLIAPYLFFSGLLLFSLIKYFDWGISNLQLWLLAVLVISAGTITFIQNTNAISNLRVHLPVAHWTRSGIFSKIKKVLPAIVICTAFLLYLLYISTIKFIDTDEVRLLFDSRMILDGLVPFSDFNARSPFLIYLLALVYPILGANIEVYYLLSAIILALSGLLFFIFIKNYFPTRHSITALVLFLSMPVILNLLYVKTQTYELLFILLSINTYLLYLKSSRPVFRYLAHASMLISLFIRPSAALFYSFHILMHVFHSRFEKKNIGLFRLIVEIFTTGLIFTILSLFYFSNAGFIYTDNTAVFGIDDQSVERLLLTFNFLPAVVILIASATILGAFFARHQAKHSKILILGSTNVVLLFALYLYHAWMHGFWPQYYAELLIGLPIVITCGIEIFSRGFQNRRILYAFLISLVLITFPASYKDLKNYMGVYSKTGVERASSIIQKNTSERDVIFGGSPVYAFLAERQHFLNVSHTYYDRASVYKISNSMAENPPEIIVYDIYMDIYFGSNPSFKRLLQECYGTLAHLEGTDLDKYWSIRVFKLKPVCNL